MANGASRRILNKEERRELEEWYHRRPSEDPFGLSKLKRNSCSNCKACCSGANRFCISCGRENENFSMHEFFFFSSGHDIGELRAKECRLNHPNTRAAIKQFPHMPFCSLCGADCAT